MKRSLLTTIFLVLVITVFAQQRETRNLDSFNELSVSEGIEVKLVKGSSEKAEIYADDIDIEDVITDVSGRSLEIYLKGNNHRNIDVEITLTFRELDEINISSAARVEGDDVISAQSMEIGLSSAAKGDLVIEAGSVEIDISSAAKLELRGKAEDLEVDVSSAGSLDAFDLECREAEIGVSSAGSVEITVTENLEADASSGGKVRYRGNPDKVYADANSGGSIKKD